MPLFPHTFLLSGRCFLMEGEGNMPNLLTMNTLTNESILNLIGRAAAFEKGEELKLGGTIANLFFEPSTRTKMSFEMAEHKLGIAALPFETGFSSVLKG